MLDESSMVFTLRSLVTNQKIQFDGKIDKRATLEYQMVDKWMNEYSKVMCGTLKFLIFFSILTNIQNIS